MNEQLFKKAMSRLGRISAEKRLKKMGAEAFNDYMNKISKKGAAVMKKRFSRGEKLLD